MSVSQGTADTHELGLGNHGLDTVDQRSDYRVSAYDLPILFPATAGRPWRTDSELAMVRDWFYPRRTIPNPYAIPEGDTRQLAIDMVRLYSFNDRKTPHSMIATAYLSEALVHDEQTNREQHIGYVAMSSIYAMASVKFVNGFVDRDIARSAVASLRLADQVDSDDESDASELSDDFQDAELRARIKGGGESSMYAYAAKIGMPEAFVDVRHQIVHGEIPDLQFLREQTHRALDWLWEKWWRAHATGDPARALRIREERKLQIEPALITKAKKRKKGDDDIEDVEAALDK